MDICGLVAVFSCETGIQSQKWLVRGEILHAAMPHAAHLREEVAVNATVFVLKRKAFR
jgi:hypothetical protein